MERETKKSVLIESSAAMSARLNTVVLQTDLHWHDPERNLNSLSKQIGSLQGEIDLIVLPEMFTSGFTNHPESLNEHDGALDWLKEQASKKQAAVVGSVAMAVDDGFRNRLLFVEPDGVVSYYDKTHLFTVAGEHRRYEAGDKRIVVNYRGWRLLLIVCYDLRFPVFCRNQNDYDAMICVANWPASRRYPWQTLLKARAIENQSYVLGCNRVGIDGNNIEYTGDSMIVGPEGDVLSELPAGETGAVSGVLEHSRLHRFRKKYPFLNDADAFSLSRF